MGRCMPIFSLSTYPLSRGKGSRFILKQREEAKDWHHFEVPEEIYDQQFSLVNIPYLANYLLGNFNSKQREFITNVEKTLKVH